MITDITRAHCHYFDSVCMGSIIRLQRYIKTSTLKVAYNTNITVNQVKLLYPYYAFPFWYAMHGRDTTVLIDLL